MILRAKLAYITVGFQLMGIIVFTLFGKLSLAFLAGVFAYMGWASGEFYSNYKGDDNAEGN